MEDNFQWTDKSVLDFASQLMMDRIKFAITHDLSAAPKPMQTYLNDFKASKLLVKRGWEAVSACPIEGTIHSVKRLSDGEVFTVGDLVDTKGSDEDVFDEDVRWRGLIDEMVVEGDKLYFQIRRPDERTWAISKTIENIKHAKKPLFTTEDGVEISKGDSVWSVNINDWCYRGGFSADDSWNQKQAKFNGYLYFSTEEKAQEYILMNKPMLSLNDLLDVWGVGAEYPQQKEHYKKSDLFSNFKELAKKKLNK